MKPIEKQELVDLISRFINERGLWYDWKDFIEAQGYTTQELGFEE